MILVLRVAKEIRQTLDAIKTQTNLLETEPVVKIVERYLVVQEYPSPISGFRSSGLYHLKANF